jgi:Arc/MetJ-type ribon-helix-helix transcriptional regulator
MGKSDKVTIRLDTEQADALDALVIDGDFKNRSDALRASLDKMIKGEDPNLVRVRLDDWVRMTIEGLVLIGMFDSFDSAVRHFLRQELVKMDVDEIQARIDWMRQWGSRTSSARSILENVFKDYVQK